MRCPKGFWVEQGTGTCTPCGAGCSFCNQFTGRCEGCEAGSALVNGACPTCASRYGAACLTCTATRCSSTTRRPR
jgi:hypothetical protein